MSNIWLEQISGCQWEAEEEVDEEPERWFHMVSLTGYLVVDIVDYERSR